MRYFSPSTGSFYSEALHGARKIEGEISDKARKAGRTPPMVDNPACTIPHDAVPVTEEHFAELMAEQGEGRVISFRAGRPVHISAGVRSREENTAIIRRKRDKLLRDSDWTQLGETLTDAAEYKTALANWRQALRDMDLEAGVFPEQPTL